MLWVYGHYKYFDTFSTVRGPVDRLYLQTADYDVTVPALKGLRLCNFDAKEYFLSCVTIMWKRRG